MPSDLTYHLYSAPDKYVGEFFLIYNFEFLSLVTCKQIRQQVAFSYNFISYILWARGSVAHM